MCINVGPWVFNFAQAVKIGRHKLEALSNNLDERIIRHVFQGKISLTHVAGIGLSKHCVTETRYNL